MQYGLRQNNCQKAAYTFDERVASSTSSLELSNLPYTFRLCAFFLINKRDRKDYFSLDDLMSVLERQNYKCAITGQEFELKKYSPKIPSIDRINPKKNGGLMNWITFN